MPDSNPFMDAGGLSSTPAPTPRSSSNNPFMDAAGIKYPEEDTNTWGTAIKNVGKHLAIGTGKLLDAPSKILESMLPHQDEQDAAERSPSVFENISKNTVGQPEGETTPFDRTVGATIEALPSGAGAGPGGLISAGLSGAASQAAAEAGAGPGTQAAAGILASMTPWGAMTAARRVAAGPASQIPNLEQNAQIFEKAGVSPELAQLKAVPNQPTTGPTQYSPNGGNIGSNTVIPGGGPLAANRAAQPGQAQATVERVAQEQSPDFPLKGLNSGEAGEAINEGVKADRKRMAAEEDQAFQTVRTLIGKDTPVDAKNFQATATSINHPTGIPEVDSFLTGAKTKAAEAAANATKTPNTSPSPAIIPTLPRSAYTGYAQGTNNAWGENYSGLYNTERPSVYQESGVTDWPYSRTETPKPPLTYDALRAMRSKVGSSIDWGLSPANPGPNGELKTIYKAMGQDLSHAADESSPLARIQQQQANTLYAQNSAKRELLDTVVDKIGGPSKVFKAATSGLKDDASTIGTVMDAMSPQQQGTLRGTIANRLGHPGGSLDRSWDENTYLTNWQNIASPVKDKVFGFKGTPTRDTLDAVEGVLQLRKDLGYSSSKLSQGVETGVRGALSHALTAGAALMGESLMHHTELVVPTAVAGTAGAFWNAAMSRVSTNPAALNWLRQAAKAPKGMTPALIAQLQRMGPTGADIQAMVNQDHDEEGK